MGLVSTSEPEWLAGHLERDEVGVPDSWTNPSKSDEGKWRGGGLPVTASLRSYSSIHKGGMVKASTTNFRLRG